MASPEERRAEAGDCAAVFGPGAFIADLFAPVRLAPRPPSRDGGDKSRFEGILRRPMVQIPAPSSVIESVFSMTAPVAMLLAVLSGEPSAQEHDGRPKESDLIRTTVDYSASPRCPCRSCNQVKFGHHHVITVDSTVLSNAL